MIEVPTDLGRRIVEAARLAAALHLRAEVNFRASADFGRRVRAGGAGYDLLTDDEPTHAGLPGQATSSRRSSWTSAGEYPAGPFSDGGSYSASPHSHAQSASAEGEAA